MEDDLKALARRCVPDPTLERFFRDEESEEGPARWTPVHLERYARVLAADGTLDRRRTVTGIARTDRRSHSPRDDEDEDEVETLTTGDFRAKLRAVGKYSGKLKNTRASIDSSQALAAAESGRGDLPDVTTKDENVWLPSLADNAALYAAFTPAILHRGLLNAHAKQLEEVRHSNQSFDSSEKQSFENVQMRPETFSVDGALFFVDISGFTKLSGRLTADELKYHCNAYFGLLLGVISRHGGDVLKFLGDAFFVLWPCATDASSEAKACNAWRAARCAVDVMRSCATYDAGAGAHAVSLRLHCGLGVGKVHVYVVGACDRWELVVAGDPVRQLSETEGEAERGQVVLSKETVFRLRSALVAYPLPLSETSRGNYRLDWSHTSTKPSMATQDSDRMAFLSCEKRPNYTSIMNDRTAFGDQASDEARSFSHKHVREANWSNDPPQIGGPSPDDAEAVNEARAKRQAFGKTVRCVARPLRAFAPEASRADLDAGTPGLLGALRDVVTVFVDVNGLSDALEGGDVDRVQSAMEATVRAVRAWDGMLRQFAVDDKGVVFIACWGVPGHAHEDDEARAVSSAKEVLAALSLQGLEARAGVASGNAFCGLVGNAARAEYAVIGSSVNLAARLMCHAPPSSVLVSGTVRDRALSSFDFEGKGSVRAKGYEDPIPVYRPMRREVRTEVELVNETIGREDERRQVSEALENGVTFLIGPQGAGKSRLLRDALLASNKRVVWCSASGGAPVLAPCAWALCAGASDTCTFSGRAASSKALIEGGASDQDADALARLLNARRSSAGVISNGAASVARAVSGIVKKAGSPVLFIDDAQDLGAADWAVLSLLDAPCAILVGMRPIGRYARNATAARNALVKMLTKASVIALDPLSIAETASLFTACLGLYQGSGFDESGRLHDRAARALHAKTNGEPHRITHAATVIKARLDASDLESELASLTPDARRRDLKRTVVARFDALSRLEQAVLAAASVLGASFCLEPLVSIVSKQTDEATHDVIRGEVSTMRSRLRYALVTLIERNFLRKRRRNGQEEFEFSRSDVRSDVYGLLPVLTRQRLHGFASDFYEEDFVRAHHLVHAGTSRSPERALIAVAERCSITPETRPEAILAYSLLLHVELAGQGSCGSPAYAALLKPAWHETDIFLQPDQEWLEPELFESPPHGVRIAAILQALASLEFSLGHSRTAYATASAGLAALGDASNSTMARLRALRSIILAERGELERASAEAAKAVSCEEDQDTPGPYHISLSSSSPEAVCLACASLGDAAHLRKAARLIPRTKSNYATGFVLRAAARFHARRNDPDACASAACGAARAFDACHEPSLATEARATEALAYVTQGRARAAMKALLAVEGPPAPRADAARAAAVAAVAKLCGDEETYEACARAAGDEIKRAAEALAAGVTVDDGEAPEVMVDAVDPWLSLSAYLGNVAEEFIS